MRIQQDSIGSWLKLGAITAVPFGAFMVLLQTTATGHELYFLRAVAVWMGFVAASGWTKLTLKPESRGGWSRFFAFAAWGAVDGLWTAQMAPLSLGDASPIEFGVRATLFVMFGFAWYRAMTNIDRANPPKLPSIRGERAGELTDQAVPHAG